MIFRKGTIVEGQLFANLRNFTREIEQREQVK